METMDCEGDGVQMNCKINSLPFSECVHECKPSGVKNIISKIFFSLFLKYLSKTVLMWKVFVSNLLKPFWNDTTSTYKMIMLQLKDPDCIKKWTWTYLPRTAHIFSNISLADGQMIWMLQVTLVCFRKTQSFGYRIHPLIHILASEIQLLSLLHGNTSNGLRDKIPTLP